VTCPNATEVQAVTQAIQQGVVTWHAMPFNPQYEVHVLAKGSGASKSSKQEQQAVGHSLGLGCSRFDDS
jgi:hypothetical protein